MTTFDKLKGAAATLADAAVKTTGDLAQKGKSRWTCWRWKTS